MTTPVVLIGLYSNPGLASKLDRLRSEPDPSDPATSVQRPRRQRQKRLSHAELAQLIDDRENGRTIKELADRYSIHRTTVMDHLARAGIEPKTGKLARHLDEARQLRAKGWSYARLGARFSVHPETVRRYLLVDNRNSTAPYGHSPSGPLHPA